MNRDLSVNRGGDWFGVETIRLPRRDEHGNLNPGWYRALGYRLVTVPRGSTERQDTGIRWDSEPKVGEFIDAVQKLRGRVD